MINFCRPRRTCKLMSIFNSSHVGRRSVQVLGFLWGWGLHIFRIIYIHLLGRRNFGMCYGASCRSLYEMKVLLQNLKKEIMTISSTWFVKMCMHSIFSWDIFSIFHDHSSAYISAVSKTGFIVKVKSDWSPLQEKLSHKFCEKEWGNPKPKLQGWQRFSSCVTVK